MKYVAALILLSGIVLGCLAPRAAAAPGELDNFDKFRKIYSLKEPAAVRIPLYVALLREELAHPSSAPGSDNGTIITTGKVQATLLFAMSEISGEDPAPLREAYAAATHPLVKDLLAVALVRVGDHDRIDEVIRIAGSHPEGIVRRGTLRTLSRALQDPLPTDVPKRLRQGEVWHPVTAKQRAEIVQVFKTALKDPFRMFYSADRLEENAGFPVQKEAASCLRGQGYRVKPVPAGWEVTDPQGQRKETVRFNRGKAPIPSEFPQGMHDL